MAWIQNASHTLALWFVTGVVICLAYGRKVPLGHLKTYLIPVVATHSPDVLASQCFAWPRKSCTEKQIWPSLVILF